MGRSSIGWRRSATSNTVSDDIPDPGIIVIGKNCQIGLCGSPPCAIRR